MNEDASSSVGDTHLYATTRRLLDSILNIRTSGIHAPVGNSDRTFHMQDCLHKLWRNLVRSVDGLAKFPIPHRHQIENKKTVFERLCRYLHSTKKKKHLNESRIFF
jgi:hypothetical protein